MPEREILFDRINRRVDIMMEMGALEEARKVYPLRHLNSLNTVGFKELFAYFDGTMTLDEAISRLKKNTRVYAKKQMLWCRKQQQN
jgi:tRNA dimethylallyltransferase